MDTVYVIGHKNPDTDSVVSAIAYASLRNALGGDHYIPARYGHLNTETAFLLERFGFPSPLYLRNVRTQVSDIDYDTPPVLGSTVPVSYAWQVLHDDNNRISGLPVIDDNEQLYGLVTAGSLAENDMRSVNDPVVSSIPVYNLLSALDGHIINADDNIIDDIPFVVSGLEYKNWLVFLYLKVNVTTLQNDYLRAVVEITDRFDELKNNLLTHIISVSHKDTHFMELYNARKKIIRNFPNNFDS